MLKQYHKQIFCRLNGKEKDFYYTVVEEPSAQRFGARWGCNDKRLCQDCITCWLNIRKTVSLPEHAPAPTPAKTV